MNNSMMRMIRYSVAFVFMISGIMKLISTELGNYFIHLGLPFPLTLLYITATIEITCGVALIANKFVKKASMPLIGVMIAAILLTKVPSMSTSMIQAAFDARLDIVMLILLFLLYKYSPGKSSKE